MLFYFSYYNCHNILKLQLFWMTRGNKLALVLFVLVVCTHQVCQGTKDGLFQVGEECDNSGTGCSSTCQVENNFKCFSEVGSASVCTSTLCGDGIIDTTARCDGRFVIQYRSLTPRKYEICRIDNSADAEQCDFGGVRPGCSSTCKVQIGYRCQNDISKSLSGEPAVNPQTISCGLLCGNGFIDNLNNCDGSQVFLAGGNKYYICKVGSVSNAEQCDDGGIGSGDGCDNSCKVQNLYKCKFNKNLIAPGSRQSSCSLACNDGVIDTIDICDRTERPDGSGDPLRGFVCRIDDPALSQNCDGSGRGVTGCDTTTCRVQTSFRCINDRSMAIATTGCTRMFCSDGIIDRSAVCNGVEVSTGATTGTVCQMDLSANEECDDGDRTNDNGCDTSCQIENKFKCVNDVNAATPQSVCSPTCGDGLIDTTVNCNKDQIPFGAKKLMCRIDSTADDEKCDDDDGLGAAADGDGCSSTCTLQSGAICSNLGTYLNGVPCATLTTLCGNGKMDIYTCDGSFVGGLACTLTGGATIFTEKCEPSIPGGGGACDSTCQVLNDDYSCNRDENVCTYKLCKNGVVDKIGTCDGQTFSGAYICKAASDYDQQCDREKFCTTQCRDVKPQFADDIVVPDLPPLVPDSDSQSTPQCGNKKVQQFEQCDNGRGIGCRACIIESGYKCENNGTICMLEESTTPPVVESVCGDGVKEGIEVCDNGNNIGCSSNCKQDLGFTCEEDINKLSVCTSTNVEPVCGNGIIEGSEKCDNGNQFGCIDCIIDSRYTCRNFVDKKSQCTQIKCGNLIRQPGQECDNGNYLGCLGCKRDPRYICNAPMGTVSDCQKIPICGDGEWQPLNQELCDDNNVAAGDGCNQICRIEQGYECLSMNGIRGLSKCTKIENFVNNCGNSILEEDLDEQCDDGNNISGEGCSSDCKKEPGWKCSLIPDTMRSSCTFGVCPNFYVEGLQECDDGNDSNFDGCSSNCKIERGFACAEMMPGIYSFCYEICGNGYLQVKFGQECDDGNRNPLDGCSPFCEKQPGASCINQEGQTSICTP